MFTVKTEYTKNIVLNTLEDYARHGRLTKDKTKLLNFIEESKYNGFNLRLDITEHHNTMNYRVYVWNEISLLFESVLKKPCKAQWLPFLEHNLYMCYQWILSEQ